MSVPPAWPQVLDFFGTVGVLELSPDQLTGDAGRLLVRQFDQRTGLTRAFGGSLDNSNEQDHLGRMFLGLVFDGSTSGRAMTAATRSLPFPREVADQ
jgi:hypothetical protein